MWRKHFVVLQGRPCIFRGGRAAICWIGTKAANNGRPNGLLCAVASERRRAKWKAKSESIGCGSAWKRLTGRTRRMLIQHVLPSIDKWHPFLASQHEASKDKCRPLASSAIIDCG